MHEMHTSDMSHVYANMHTIIIYTLMHVCMHGAILLAYLRIVHLHGEKTDAKDAGDIIVPLPRIPSRPPGALQLWGGGPLTSMTVTLSLQPRQDRHSALPHQLRAAIFTGSV